MRICAFAAAILACTVSAALAQGPADLRSIPGTDGGWDYASVDTATNRFFVAHGDSVASIDLANPVVVTLFAPARHAHSVLPIPGRDEILVTDGDTATARLIDAKTGAVRAAVAVGQKPDAAIWDAYSKRAIVMNAKSGTVMAIDPATAKVTATVTLAPGLEYAVVGPRGLLYVNNEDNNDITIVDLATSQVIAKVALPGCKGPTGMAWAPNAKRIVSSCDGAATLFDPTTRKVTGTIAIGGGPDAVIPDPLRSRLYIPSGDDGTLAVLEDSPAGVKLVKTIPTVKGARTGAVDPRDGRVYLPVSDFAPNPAGGRPKQVPGTFRILVIDPSRP